MANKSILFTAPYVTELIDKDIPVPKENEVLIKIVRSTVSAGTERANLSGDANTNSTKAAEVKFPRSGGYSTSGIVAAVGDAVESVKVGDRVAAAWTKHAQYCVRPECDVYLLPDEVGFGEAALINISTFSLAAIRKCRLEVGESALVMGLGVLGLLAVKLLRVSGACPIIAVDPVKSKREQAIAYGADYALDPFEEGFAQTVKSLTGGGVKVAIEVTGLGSGLDMALDCMAQFGRVALLGCTRNSNFSIDYYRKVHGRGVTLIGAHTQARPERDSSSGWWSERDDFLAVINMIKHRRLDLCEMIEEVHSPQDAKEVYYRLVSDKSFPVVQFDWSLT